MSRIAGNAVVYAALVVGAGFCLGAFRTLWLAPRIGDVAAVAAELPVILALSWIAAGAILRRWPLPATGARVVMGGLAFLVLMAAEAGLAWAFGQSPRAWVAGLATPAGALGLGGQLVFAAIPALRR